MSASISPDGKWMAYLSDETGRLECFVRTFPVPGRKYRVTTNGAVAAWWRKDSRQLVLMDAENQLLQSDVVPGADFSTTTPRVVGHLPKSVQSVDAPADLQRVLALTLEGGSASMSIALVQNWAAGFRK
jgi:Tol biopolymer transport system component